MSEKDDAGVDRSALTTVWPQTVTDIRNVHVKCPNCDIGTELDPPMWDCETCGERLRLVVEQVAITHGDKNLEGSK
jgi:hypothetical protein